MRKVNEQRQLDLFDGRKKLRSGEARRLPARSTMAVVPIAAGDELQIGAAHVKVLRVTSDPPNTLNLVITSPEGVAVGLVPSDRGRSGRTMFRPRAARRQA